MCTRRSLRSATFAIACVGLQFSTQTEGRASPPSDGLRWTAQDLPLPLGVTSLVATGATEDGVIVAHGLKFGQVNAFVYMPSAAFGFVTGWNDLGAAHPRHLLSTAVASSGRAGASIVSQDGQPEFTLAIADSFEECGTGFTESLADNTDGWVTAVCDSGIAAGVLIGQSAEGAVRFTPFSASAAGGLQVVTIPEGFQNAVPWDQSETGWMVGTAQSPDGWRGVAGPGCTLLAMAGRIRNRPDAVLDSCVGVTVDLKIVANEAVALAQYRPILLTDARADHLPTGTVDSEDLVGYLIDYGALSPRADMDASGSVTEADADGFVDLWVAAQISGQQQVCAPDPLSMYTLAIRGGASELCPEELRAAASGRLRQVIVELSGAPDASSGPVIAADCQYEEFDRQHPENHNYCGSGAIDVPDFFAECCSNHDNCYRGFSPRPAPSPPGPPAPGGRRGCDDEFLACMNAACDQDQRCWIKNFGCHLIAGIYHLGVRAFGKGAFCECRQLTDPEDCGTVALETQLGALGSAVLP